jgi:hypothetical protein
MCVLGAGISRAANPVSTPHPGAVRQVPPAGIGSGAVAGTTRTRPAMTMAAKPPRLISHRDPRAESASVATTVGERSRFSDGFGVADVGRRGGNRPATVQHVEAERNEQSGSIRGAAEDDSAAAHPWRSAMPSRIHGQLLMASSQMPVRLGPVTGCRGLAAGRRQRVSSS